MDLNRNLSLAKILVNIFLLLSCFVVDAQEDTLLNEHFKEYFWCDSLLLGQPELIMVGSHSLRYYVVHSYQVIGSRGPMHGTIILPDIKVTDDVNFIVSIANTIATKESLDEIVLFKTCAGERSYMSAIRTKYTKRSVRENFLGRFVMNE